jgi:glycosyltransferase involved in cell wall biosynthesis
VPVPTPDEYFQIADWRHGGHVRVPCRAYVFPHPDVPADALWDAPQVLGPAGAKPRGVRELVRSLKGGLREKARLAYRNFVKPLVPPAAHALLKAVAGGDAWDAYARRCRRSHLDLSGVVYVSIFNPADRRKNWEDLLTGFLTALRDCPDAMLVVKLITRQQMWIDRMLAYYRRCGLAHRCKVAFITDYLPHQHMLDLVRAGTYYLTTTRGEGNCLPVMNYLAAGRPCISPCHTAISDYFTSEMGFLVDTHPEPAIWPHDARLRFRTTWGRLVWPSLVEQLRRSYQVARGDRAVYEAMAAAGRNKMAQWASAESIWPRLRAALDLVDQVRAQSSRAA